jgi:hypothetical protein
MLCTLVEFHEHAGRMSVNFHWNRWHHILQDSTPYSQRCETNKSNMWVKCKLCGWTVHTRMYWQHHHCHFLLLLHTPFIFTTTNHYCCYDYSYSTAANTITTTASTTTILPLSPPTTTITTTVATRKLIALHLQAVLFFSCNYFCPWCKYGFLWSITVESRAWASGL